MVICQKPPLSKIIANRLTMRQGFLEKRISTISAVLLKVSQEMRKNRKSPALSLVNVRKRKASSRRDINYEKDTSLDLCTFSSTFRETIDHLFFYCAHSGAFWYDFESYWFTLTKEQRKLDLKTIIIGDRYSMSFNYLIVLGKLHLWNCRRNR